MATFTKTGLTIMDAHGTPILRGKRNTTGPCVWTIDITPQPALDTCLASTALLPVAQSANSSRMLPHVRAYDLPNTPALVAYLHAAVGYLVKSTWLHAIKHGHYRSWPGLTYQGAACYCPDANEIHRGHMAQPK